jgi:TolB protein
MTNSLRIMHVFMCIVASSYSAMCGTVQVKATQHVMMRLNVCSVGPKSSRLERALTQIKKDLSFSNQFDVALDHAPTVVKNEDVRLFSQAGFPLVLFVSKGAKGTLEWRLYDTERAVMLVGKIYTKRGKLPETWGHHIADAVWPVLTGQQGFFSTKIAYCKEKKRTGKKVLMYIYFADYDGSHEKLLVSSPTVNVSPRWNCDKNHPCLLYSEYANSNVRLIAVDMAGHRSVVSNFDGVNMQTAFSSDGKKAVFSSSRGGRNCQLYYSEQGILKKLTNNTGNNIGPTFADDGKTLFFCSDYQTGNPQIYRYEFATGVTERITDSGYCVSPSYCQCTDTVAYSKMVQGTMQIFVYDVKTKTHQQLTFDAGNKDDCSWSPCGNYLLYSVGAGRASRLAMLNKLTKEQQFITAEGSVCCYPAWSISYNNFLEA